MRTFGCIVRVMFTDCVMFLTVNCTHSS